jgi:hypothetical protein
VVKSSSIILSISRKWSKEIITHLQALQIIQNNQVDQVLLKIYIPMHLVLESHVKVHLYFSTQLSQLIYTLTLPAPAISPGQKWPQIGSVKNRNPLEPTILLAL